MSEIADKGAPTRHALDWENPDFYDETKLDEEMRRVFDICHGCRRCFNLCESFPRLFDLVDESETGELESVESADFKPVVDACTLCDMCFVNKCPYVPPHEFDLDFPHLMLRYRAVELKKKGIPFIKKHMTNMDLNAKLAAPVSGLINWATDVNNQTTRKVLQKVTGIHPKAYLPAFQQQTYVKKNATMPPLLPNDTAPGFGEKVVLYVTCYGNYHQSSIADAAHKILSHNGVDVEIAYPGCCGMPLLEQGDLSKVANKAKAIAAHFKMWIEKGYKILALVPSCTLMMKQEWPLLLPQNDDIQTLATHTHDVIDYLISLFKTKGIAAGLTPIDTSVTLHLACHSRAQNKGAKAAELLRLIPNTGVDVIERCSGHGGAWGVMDENFEIALKVGKPVFRQAIANAHGYVSSECPLAGEHIRQGITLMQEQKDDDGEKQIFVHAHPLEIFAHAYNLLDLAQK